MVLHEYLETPDVDLDHIYSNLLLLLVVLCNPNGARYLTQEKI